MYTIITAYILDLIFGDPQGHFHPVRFIGNLITYVEHKLRKQCKSHNDELKAGVILWLVVVSISFLIPLIIVLFAKQINYYLGFIIEVILCYYILATKSLKDESMKVYTALKSNNLAEARKYLSYIVGRDTDKLDEKAIAKAAVETVAENTSDGVIAPMLFIMIGGAPLGYLYKAVNTLDSMVGYKNDKYINMGRFSAKADDLFNYVPARLSAIIMIAAAFILKFDFNNAIKIYKRDRYNHKSPNSAHTESVCAGALKIMLGGSSYYKGILVDKPTIGDEHRQAETEDIKRANTLMYATSLLFLIIGIGILIII